HEQPVELIPIVGFDFVLPVVHRGQHYFQYSPGIENDFGEELIGPSSQARDSDELVIRVGLQGFAQRFAHQGNTVRCQVRVAGDPDTRHTVSFKYEGSAGSLAESSSLTRATAGSRCKAADSRSQPSKRRLARAAPRSRTVFTAWRATRAASSGSPRTRSVRPSPTRSTAWLRCLSCARSSRACGM